MTLDFKCDGILVEWSDDRVATPSRETPDPPEDSYLPEPSLDIVPIHED